MSDKFKPRSEQDRRAIDNGPPTGWKERRRNTERRMPEVKEISIAEFKRMMAENRTPETNTDENTSFDWGEVRKL